MGLKTKHLAIFALLGAFVASSPVLPNICEVQPSFCKNGGTCVSEDTGRYTCKCSPGFEGEHCGKRTNDCNKEVEFCANGGKCLHDFELGSACRCRHGFGGRQCEVQFDLCADGYCLNGGTCRDKNKCSCPDGFTGTRCEKAVPTLAQYNASGCPTPQRCQELYRDGKCDEECQTPNCYNDGFDCQISKSELHELHDYLSKCAFNFRTGFDSDNERNPEDQASTQSLQGPFSMLMSACALLILVAVIAAVVVKQRRKYEIREQSKLFQFGSPTDPGLHCTQLSPECTSNGKPDPLATEITAAPDIKSDFYIKPPGLAMDAILKSVAENKTEVAKAVIASTKSWCLENNADFANFVNAADWQGISPIHHAIMYNNAALVHELLATDKCDVYATNNRGQNALIAAADANHSSNHIVRMVLTYMINNPPYVPEVPTTGKGRNTREYFYSSVAPRGPLDFKLFTDVLGRSAMHYAAMNGNTALIGELSLSGFSVNARCHKEETPIFLAIRENRKATVELLITLGANVLCRSAEGYTPVDIAERTGSAEILKILRTAAGAASQELENQRKRRARE